jgi:hypothetical protein
MKKNKETTNVETTDKKLIISDVINRFFCKIGCHDWSMYLTIQECRRCGKIKNREWIIETEEHYNKDGILIGIQSYWKHVKSGVLRKNSYHEIVSK